MRDVYDELYGGHHIVEVIMTDEWMAQRLEEMSAEVIEAFMSDSFGQGYLWGVLTCDAADAYQEKYGELPPEYEDDDGGY